MTQLAPAIPRHPELVSGSISRAAQVWPDESDFSARPRAIAPTARGEKWTLKRVQGDGGEFGLEGTGVMGLTSLIDEASDFLLSFDDADPEAQIELADGLLRIADATARFCGAESFLDLAERPDIVLIGRFCAITRDDYATDIDLGDPEGPDPGWFAVIHLMGLNLVKALPNDELALSAAQLGARLYSLRYAELQMGIANAPNQ